MPIPVGISEQLEDLAFFEDRASRIEALLALAEEYRPCDEQTVPRSLENRVPGCESEVFFRANSPSDLGHHFRFAVDNPQGISAMALAVILEKAIGEPRQSFSGIQEEIVFQIFGKELSMGKNLGLTNMVRMLKKSASSA